MQDVSRIRIELGISAQQITQQVMINNKAIEEQIKQGIELALDDVLNKDNFVENIRQAARNEIEKTIKDSLGGWEVQKQIKKMIELKLSEKIEAFAEKIAEQLTEKL